MKNLNLLSQVYPTNFIRNLVVTHVDDENIQVGLGSCRDSTDKKDIDLTTTVNADLTVSGAGGLDTGSVAADTFYAVHVILDSSGNNSNNVIYSLTATAPTMPATHDLFRRLCWILTDATSDIIPFKQEGLKDEKFMRYNTEKGNTLILLAGAATSFELLNLDNIIPSTSTKVQLLYTFVPNSAGNSFAFRQVGSSIALNVII